MSHLFGNAIVVATAGTLVATGTTAVRFHLFVLITGATAGVTTVLITGFLGPPAIVLGASGAGFALLGYLLASNRVSTIVLNRLSWRSAFLLAAIVGSGIVIWLGGVDLALIGHVTGAVLGIVAGRFRLLAR